MMPQNIESKTSKKYSTFNRAARTYDSAAVLAREVADRMLSRLDLVKINPLHILDIGAGTGYAMQLLSQRYPQAKLTAIDSSEQMLSQAKEKFLGTSHQFICTDAHTLPFENASVDMIIANLMLHWCSDWQTVLKEWARVIKPNGLLMFSTYGPDTLCELRYSFSTVDKYAHVNFFVDMHDLGDALAHGGFADPVMDVETFTLLYPDVPHLLRELKNLGSHVNVEPHLSGLMGKHKFQAMCHAYEQLKTPNHKIPATYEVVYGHTWGKEIKEESDGEVAIPLSQIRRQLLRS